jgi:hypothetical protein
MKIQAVIKFKGTYKMDIAPSVECKNQILKIFA